MYEVLCTLRRHVPDVSFSGPVLLPDFTFSLGRLPTAQVSQGRSFLVRSFVAFPASRRLLLPSSLVFPSFQFVSSLSTFSPSFLFLIFLLVAFLPLFISLHFELLSSPSTSSASLSVLLSRHHHPLLSLPQSHSIESTGGIFSSRPFTTTSSTDHLAFREL